MKGFKAIGFGLIFSVVGWLLQHYVNTLIIHNQLASNLIGITVGFVLFVITIAITFKD
jgi:hypothetical protein